MIPWVKDPKNKMPSVTLSLLLVSFTSLLIASTFHISGVTQNTSSLLELFYATSAMYLGRRFTFAGKSFSADNNDSSPSQENK
jgi:hypothetical protein